jgi:hypothetical protein
MRPAQSSVRPYATPDRRLALVNARPRSTGVEPTTPMTDLVVGALLALLGALVGSLATIQIARANRKEVLRLAAVERRLVAHQEAYALWCRLLSNLHRDCVHDIAVECQAWWEKNCLYLDPQSRSAFREGIVDAALYHDLRGENDPRERFGRLRGVLDFLVKGVGLPTIGEHEWTKTPGSGQPR